MHQLLLPDQLAGRGPQRHDRVGVAIVALALAAEEIRARRAGRDEHQIALRIDREDRPGIGGAGQRRLLGLPVRMGRIGRIARDRVPEPDAPAAAGIEGLHDAELQIDRPVVADRRPGDHQIARDRGRRRDRVLAGVGEADVHGEVDRAVVAEIRARPPGARRRARPAGHPAYRRRSDARRAHPVRRRHPASCSRRARSPRRSGDCDRSRDHDARSPRPSPDRARSRCRAGSTGRAGPAPGSASPRTPSCPATRSPRPTRRCDRSRRPPARRHCHDRSERAEHSGCRPDRRHSCSSSSPCLPPAAMRRTRRRG